MKPGTASWSRVTWVASVLMILPRTGKVFSGYFELEGVEVWWQPTRRKRKAMRARGLRDTGGLLL
jgi:hypothetical protein